MSLPDLKNDSFPLIRTNVSNEDYHSGLGVSSSDLKLVLRSPRHYRYRPVQAPKKHFTVGTLLHAMLLEREQCASRYVVLPEEISSLNKNSNKYKEAIAAFKLAAGDRDIVEAKLVKQCSEMAEQAYEHPTVREIVECEFIAESSHYWIDERTGLLCKARPDLIAERIMVDIKTTSRNIRDGGFRRDCDAFHYPLSAAYYLDGCEHISGPLDEFLFFVVETEYPYGVRVFGLEYDSYKLGQASYRSGLSTLKHSLESKNFPGYQTEVVDVGYSSYKRSQINWETDTYE